MIISVEEAKKLIDINGWTDEKLERKLKAIEKTIRKYTHNEFKVFSCRSAAVISGSRICCAELMPFNVGDTVQISQSSFNEGLYTITSISDHDLTVAEAVNDEEAVLVTLVEYPEDVVDCALNLLEWDIKNRAKVGIKSETLSRHSVTYEDSASMFNGYPRGILMAASLHRKARC